MVGDEEKEGKRRVYFHLMHVFFSQLESNLLLSDPLGSQTTRVQGLPWVGSAGGSAPNICSKLQTEPNLETGN